MITPKRRRISHVELGPAADRLVDRLHETGLYGASRNAVIRGLILDRLRQLAADVLPRLGKKRP